MNEVPFNLNRNILSGRKTKKGTATFSPIHKLDALVYTKGDNVFRETNLYLFGRARAPFTTERLFFHDVTSSLRNALPVGPLCRCVISSGSFKRR
jgi:hypothetical protein